MEKPVIGITIGDLNGIGPEVIIKALSDERILQIMTPVIYANSKVLSYHRNIVGDHNLNTYNIQNIDRVQAGKVNVLHCWEDNVNITLSKATPEGGKFAMISIDYALHDAISGKIDAFVTAPIHKHAMALAGHDEIGHTEYISRKTGGKSMMMLCSDILKVGLVTNHVPISEVSGAVTQDKIIEKIKIFEDTLRKDFGTEKPVIAVLGLNPHAGDEGTIGTEDKEIVTPAILEAKKLGIFVTGPHPADGFFGSSQYHKVDGILAMYHDQGLIPFKALSFGRGVNYTAGLQVIRTSPDHGTAYDIAGKNLADPASMRTALFLAVDIVKARKQYEEDRSNPLQLSQKPIEEEETLE